MGHSLLELHSDVRMKSILVHTTILGLICMALASEMDLEPEQYSSQLSDVMLNHKLEARSDPRAASNSRLQQNRLPWYELIKKNDDVSRLAMRILKRSKMPQLKMQPQWFQVPVEY